MIDVCIIYYISMKYIKSKRGSRSNFGRGGVRWGGEGGSVRQMLKKKKKKMENAMPNPKFRRCCSPLSPPPGSAPGKKDCLIAVIIII